MSTLLARRHSAAAVFIIALACAPFAVVHKTSYAYLKALVAGDDVSGKLERAVRDFDFALFLITPSAPVPTGAARST
jgi:hypothetical protein